MDSRGVETYNSFMPDECNNPLDHQGVANLLRSHVITPTRPRVEIGLVLFADHQHLCADEILERVNRSAQRHVSKATIYNTLGLFAERGLLRQLVIDPTRIYYDSNTKPHHHFFNVESGELTDIDPHDIDLQQLPVIPAGMVSDGIDVIVRIRAAH